MPRDADRSHLHPALREKTVALDSALAAKGLPLRLFEGARSPVRQVELYARGRGTGTPGKTVTRARAWQSMHQYGCAVDYVFWVDGEWVWPPAEDPRWEEYAKLAAAVGLRSLSFERPHVELALHLAPLQAGQYPSGGDDAWRDWLETQIEAWGQEARTFSGIIHPAAPPLLIDRPALTA